MAAPKAICEYCGGEIVLSLDETWHATEDGTIYCMDNVDSRTDLVGEHEPQREEFTYD